MGLFGISFYITVGFRRRLADLVLEEEHENKLRLDLTTSYRAGKDSTGWTRNLDSNLDIGYGFRDGYLSGRPKPQRTAIFCYFL